MNSQLSKALSSVIKMNQIHLGIRLSKVNYFRGSFCICWLKTIPFSLSSCSLSIYLIFKFCLSKTKGRFLEKCVWNIYLIYLTKQTYSQKIFMFMKILPLHQKFKPSYTQKFSTNQPQGVRNLFISVEEVLKSANTLF